MNILTVDGITKSYGERKLFDEASFYLAEGEKAGVLGINGTGKSTLLKIIAGLEEPDEGRVICANHVVMGYLPQNPEFDEKLSVIEAVVKQVLDARRAKGEDEAHLLQEEPTVAAEAKNMLTRLGVYDFDAKCGVLSGGQKKRLALVAVLMSPADILILDEPTNHLDNAMADWLEEQSRPNLNQHL